jgi:ATP-binding cassette, subfamily G (WHITE), eye pigment precursor transporter
VKNKINALINFPSSGHPTRNRLFRLKFPFAVSLHFLSFHFSSISSLIAVTHNIKKTNKPAMSHPQASDTSLDDKSPLIPASSASSGGSGKSYGSGRHDSIAIAIEDRLTYTWKEIDVYGEQKVQSSFVDRVKRRFCNCLSSGGRGKEFVTRKHLLKNVTGVAHSGELLAVIGSSGAGKTTLLNALCFRSPPGIKISPTSVRALNGIPVNSEKLRSQCAYVQQDDLFIGSLTTKEHLIFQAMLRMGRNVPYAQKIIRVNEVLNELSLRKCANTIIGSPGRIKGLSGGERKRLSFASETLTDPHLLLCDEVRFI